MKTTRYYIGFENMESAMCSKMEISKAEYNRQMAYMREQVVATEHNEYTLDELSPVVHDLGTTVKTIISFSMGCAYTDLIKVECKPGYCFTNKR